MLPYHDRVRAESFGADADRYDRARPRYPAALLDDLVAGGGLRALDVGCGTGIASRLLAGLGCQVLGVEPDVRMAAVARRQGVAVEVATFEAWDPAGRSFDLVTSAQAWHWVDPVAGAAKAAGLLEPGGRVGLFWNVPALPTGLRAAVDAVYAEVASGDGAPTAGLRPSGPERVAVAADALRASDRFSGVEVRTYANPVPYTAASWVEQLLTHSDHAALAPPVQQRLADGLAAVVDGAGGSFVMPYETWLVLATRG